MNMCYVIHCFFGGNLLFYLFHLLYLLFIFQLPAVVQGVVPDPGKVRVPSLIVENMETERDTSYLYWMKFLAGMSEAGEANIHRGMRKLEMKDWEGSPD